MNPKLLIALTVILALAQVDAQVPALTSLSSKIESIASSVTGTNKTPLLSSASSAYSRISADIASSAAAAVGASTTDSASSSATDSASSSATDSSSVASESSSASSVSSSASDAQGSASDAQGSASSVLSSVTSSAQSNASNAANTLVGGNNYILQLSALAAVFIASFIVMLA